MHALRGTGILLLFCILPVAAQNPDRFASPAAGFSLHKPTGWTFVASRTKADVSTAELQQAFEQQRTVALVAMTNPESPLSDFQVTLIPRSQRLAAASPKQILELLVLPSVQEQRPGLKLESPVRELQLSGHAAAEYVATDIVRAKHLAMSVRIRAILVARGSFFYLIDVMAAAGDEQSSRDFEKILSSITLDR